MPERNRVTPFGEIVAIEQRGRFMGNRGADRRPVVHVAPWADHPDGTFVRVDGEAMVVLGDRLGRWTAGAGAYEPGPARPARGRADVLTPRGTVAVLRAGYEPALR